MKTVILLSLVAVATATVPNQELGRGRIEWPYDSERWYPHSPTSKRLGDLGYLEKPVIVLTKINQFDNELSAILVERGLNNIPLSLEKFHNVLPSFGVNMVFCNGGSFFRTNQCIIPPISKFLVSQERGSVAEDNLLPFATTVPWVLMPIYYPTYRQPIEIGELEVFEKPVLSVQAIEGAPVEGIIQKILPSPYKVDYDNLVFRNFPVAKSFRSYVDIEEPAQVSYTVKKTLRPSPTHIPAPVPAESWRQEPELEPSQFAKDPAASDGKVFFVKSTQSEDHIPSEKHLTESTSQEKPLPSDHLSVEEHLRTPKRLENVHSSSNDRQIIKTGRTENSYPSVLRADNQDTLFNPGSATKLHPASYQETFVKTESNNPFFVLESMVPTIKTSSASSAHFSPASHVRSEESFVKTGPVSEHYETFPYFEARTPTTKTSSAPTFRPASRIKYENTFVKDVSPQQEIPILTHEDEASFLKTSSSSQFQPSSLIGTEEVLVRYPSAKHNSAAHGQGQELLFDAAAERAFQKSGSEVSSSTLVDSEKTLVKKYPRPYHPHDYAQELAVNAAIKKARSESASEVTSTSSSPFRPELESVAIPDVDRAKLFRDFYSSTSKDAQPVNYVSQAYPYSNRASFSVGENKQEFSQLTAFPALTSGLAKNYYARNDFTSPQYAFEPQVQLIEVERAVPASSSSESLLVKHLPGHSRYISEVERPSTSYQYKTLPASSFVQTVSPFYKNYYSAQPVPSSYFYNAFAESPVTTSDSTLGRILPTHNADVEPYQLREYQSNPASVNSGARL